MKLKLCDCVTAMPLTSFVGRLACFIVSDLCEGVVGRSGQAQCKCSSVAQHMLEMFIAISETHWSQASCATMSFIIECTFSQALRPSRPEVMDSWRKQTTGCTSYIFEPTPTRAYSGDLACILESRPSWCWQLVPLCVWRLLSEARKFGEDEEQEREGRWRPQED